MKNLNQLSYPVILRDGTPVLIRAIRPDDKQRLLDAFHRTSRESIIFRFFGFKKDLTEKELAYLTEIDFERHVAIVATIIKNGKEEMIGVGRYNELKAQGEERVADIAFIVDDEHQNLGLGTILLKQIVTIAQNKGISRLEADVMPENENMLEVFRRSGFKIKKTMKYNMVHIEFRISGEKVGERI